MIPVHNTPLMWKFSHQCHFDYGNWPNVDLRNCAGRLGSLAWSMDIDTWHQDSSKLLSMSIWTVREESRVCEASRGSYNLVGEMFCSN